MAVSRRVQRSRGYLAIAIRDRGPIGRGLKKEYNAAAKEAWTRTAIYWHEHFRDNRFTEQHAQAAGYGMRKGQGLPRNSKAFRRSYYGRKLNSRFGGGRGQALPLVWTGDTRRRVRSTRVSSTSKGGKLSYSGASKFSFRHPRSRLRMQDEFRRLLPDEITRLAEVFDRELDQRWKPENSG